MEQMESNIIFLIFSVGCFSVELATGKPDPPKDVRIAVIGSTAHISWTIPTNIQGASWSRISIKTSSGRDVYIGSGRHFKDIRILESSSFEIDNLKICSEYYVKIQFLFPTSEVTTQKFWMTSKPRNVTVESTKIETEVNTSEIIRIHVVSFPAPTVEWRRETGFQWTVTKDKYDYRYRIESKIHIKSNVDFGKYGINICNRLGCNVQNIILTPKGLFISPSYVYVVCKRTTATVIWIPDLFGGFYEDFYVKYTDMKINNGSSNKILYNDTYQHMVYVVDGLHPGRRYHFTVLSVSILGQLRSETIECLTDEAYQVENWRTAGIATLVVGLAVLVAASVFLIRNRLKSKNFITKESDGYIEVQRSNPVFTEPYSTLQSQPESRPLQEPSTDTYDECEIAHDVDTYQSIEEGS